MYLFYNTCIFRLTNLFAKRDLPSSYESHTTVTTYLVVLNIDSKTALINIKNSYDYVNYRVTLTVLSALPVARMNSEYGLKLRQFTSAVWASTVCEGFDVLLHLQQFILFVKKKIFYQIVYWRNTKMCLKFSFINFRINLLI